MQLQQIALLASQKAKGGGISFGSGMTPTAGLMLTTVLEDLKLVRNLKMNRVTTTITLPAATNGPIQLPSDYLRMYDWFYPLPTSGGGTSQGLPQFIKPLTMEQYDSEFKDPSMANYPYFWASDLSVQAQIWTGPSGTNTVPGLFTGQGTLSSAGQIFWYPQSSGALVTTMRYMKNQPDYTTPETSSTAPWFPHSQYLITRTAADMADITGDDRKEEWMAEAEKMLHPYLIMEGDEQSAVHQIGLDPRAFHFVRNAKPTKSYPFP
jgi:hypothetical protein